MSYLYLFLLKKSYTRKKIGSFFLRRGVEATAAVRNLLVEYGVGNVAVVDGTASPAHGGRRVGLDVTAEVRRPADVL